MHSKPLNSLRSASINLAVPKPKITTRSGGRTRWTPRINGLSRSRRTGAARATVRSFAGRKGSLARARFAISFITSSTWPPLSWRPLGFRSPTWSIALGKFRCKGVSMRYSFDDAKAAERHETQYFEMFGNRGIYHKGWTAVTRHNTPWLMTAKMLPFDDDVWELYDTTKDWSQAHDLSKEMPDKLHELQRLWVIEATRNGVLPMDDRMSERMNSDTAGRPVLISGTSQVLASGMGGLNENGLINVKNKSHSITAQVVVPEGMPAEGVILSQGGIGGGWMFYVKDGKLTYIYNFLGLAKFVVTSTEA